MPAPNGGGINSDWLRDRYGDDGTRSPREPQAVPEPPTPETTPAGSSLTAKTSEPLSSSSIGGRDVTPQNLPGKEQPASKGTEGPANPDAANKPKQEGQGSEIDMEALRAKIVPKDIEKISFDEIKGQDKAVAEIKEVGDMLRFEEFYKVFGAGMPRGVLLTGPPGTGKTMLATALANSAQVAFLTADCSHVMSKWLGEPEKTVNAIFDIAEQEAAKHPNGHAILFLDEIEALIRSRDLDSHEASEKVLSIFLQRLNGLKEGGKVTVIGATNRPDKLDAAFISRMNAVIEVPLPDEAGRAAIFESRLRKCESKAKKAFPGVEIDFIGEVDYGGVARLMVGKQGENVISGRELDNLANEIVTRLAAQALNLYRADQTKAPSTAGAETPAVGKIDLDDKTVLEYAKKVGLIDTAKVLEVAKDYNKTSFMFDSNTSVERYLEIIENLKQAENELLALAGAVKEGEAKPVDAQYACIPMSRDAARRDMVDMLKKRLEEGNETILRELYLENGSMPDQIKGVVSAFMAKTIDREDAFKLLDEMREDHAVEPPHVPQWEPRQHQPPGEPPSEKK